MTPTNPHSLNLESLYMTTPASLGADGPGAHGIRLRLAIGAEPSVWTGTLQLDPNACSLNAFGDREGCTRIAIRSFAVTATLMRLADPKGLGRSFYSLHGEGLPTGTALIMDPRRERIVLKHDATLVPLFPDGHA